METFRQRSNNKKIKRFKSYYVVWKRYYEKREYGDWEMFKSYYVVWKLLHLRPPQSLPRGLNRTM